MTWRQELASEEQHFTALKESLKDGLTLWDGGEVYGSPERNSLHLMNEYFTKYPEDADKVVLCIKSGVNPHNMMEPQQDRAGIQLCMDRCIAGLGGKKKLDIFEAARQAPGYPVEVTVAAMAEYVKAGKIGGIGLSEVSADTIRRAQKVHPIASVEVELSLWCTDILSNGIAATCKELGIPILAYSPLGRGFLTGQIKTFEDVEKFNPVLLSYPRFQKDVFHQNLWLVDEVQKLAEKKGCTPAQVSLAWVRALANSDKCGDIIAIPAHAWHCARSVGQEDAVMLVAYSSPDRQTEMRA